jgi:hypothetical protein
MRILITAIAIALLTVSAHAQGARMGKGKKQQQDTQKTEGASQLLPNTIPCKAFTKMNLGIGTLEGRLPLILEVLKTKLYKIWKFNPSFSPSAVSIFTRPFRRSAAANALKAMRAAFVRVRRYASNEQ